MVWAWGLVRGQRLPASLFVFLCPGHKPRSYSMTNYKSAPAINPPDSAIMPDHPHNYAACRVTTPHSPSKATPPVLSIPGASNKPFSMSADNLDSEPCASATSEPNRSTSHPESRHDKLHHKEVVGRLAPPTSRSRGHLSVSTGNMQTHV
jgi:hypothetical protein